MGQSSDNTLEIEKGNYNHPIVNKYSKVEHHEINMRANVFQRAQLKYNTQKDWQQANCQLAGLKLDTSHQISKWQEITATTRRENLYSIMRFHT